MEGGPTSPPSLSLSDLRAVAVLGRGAKGLVFLVHLPSSPSPLALKAISKSNLSPDAFRRLWFERDVLSSLHFPLLPTLQGVVSTDLVVAFAIDRCSGGDLSSLRKKQTEKMFSDDVIRFYAAEIIMSLDYLHGIGIVYRDLKPENVLIQDNGHLMLVDFDLSTKLVPKPSPSPEANNQPLLQPSRSSTKLKSWFSCGSESGSADPQTQTSSSSSVSSSTSSVKSNSFVGTEEYVAPEIIEGSGHDFAVDYWSLGVVLYEMLYGKTPFRGQNRKETFYRVLTMSPNLAGEATPLRDLIRKLLEKDPTKRITGDEIKRHEFFGGVDWDTVVEISRPPFIPAVDPETDGEDIDVEKFVREVFSAPGDVADGEKKKVVDDLKSETTCELKGQWVDGLGNPSTNPDFSVF